MFNRSLVSQYVYLQLVCFINSAVRSTGRSATMWEQGSRYKRPSTWHIGGSLLMCFTCPFICLCQHEGINVFNTLAMKAFRFFRELSQQDQTQTLSQCLILVWKDKEVPKNLKNCVACRLLASPCHLCKHGTKAKKAAYHWCQVCWRFAFVYEEHGLPQQYSSRGHPFVDTGDTNHKKVVTLVYRKKLLIHTQMAYL